MNQAVAARRLLNQQLTRPRRSRPEDVVSWLGAVQAQEYGPARWGVAQRLQGHRTDADVQRAFDDGRLLRTHVMRPTWHFVTPADIRWLLALTAPRVQQRMAPYDRRLELDGRLLARAAAAIERALAGGASLTRQELRVALERARIDARAQRLAHIMLYAELQQVVCSGPRRGRQFTYALVADRAPGAHTLPRDEALALLAKRYLRSHGPATVRDFVWWSGLTTADGRRGFEMNGARPESIGGLSYWSLPERRGVPGTAGVHLLPIYDEYLIAYQDRVAVPHGPLVMRSMAGPATFQHALVIDGQVAGRWRAERTEGHVRVNVVPCRRLGRGEREAVLGQAERYARFLRVRLELTVGSVT